MDSAAYRSSKNTSYKQVSLRHMLVKTMAIIGAIRSNPDHLRWALRKDPIYIDLFSGPGCDPATGEYGSPLLFMEIAKLQPYRIQALFYDRDSVSMRSLSSNLSRIEQPRNVTYTLHNKDNSAVKDWLPKQPNGIQLGVAYADPSNADLNSAFQPLRDIAIAYRRVDLILNYAAASWKRQRELDHYRNLMEFLNEIPKQRWFIRKPIDRFQWTMLFGTNYLSFGPEEKREWYDVRSEDGKRLLEQVAYTREELESSRQMSLFGEQ